MAVNRYLLFWKPYGVLSQFSPEVGSKHATLAEFVKIPGVYPVGRLDWDSEGLMLLTDDGELQHRFTDPRFEHPRTYWVQVEGEASDDVLVQLRQGVKVQDYVAKAASARRLTPEEVAHLPERAVPIRFRAAIPTSWIEIEITEGRNRQVRRMTAAVGLPTLRLLRAKMGELTLDKLTPGESREINPPKLPPRPGPGFKPSFRPRSR